MNPVYHKRMIKDATEGSKRSARLVSWCHKSASVYPVLPSLVISTDDTTMTTKGDQWYLLEGETHDRSTQSPYSSEVGGTDHLSGMRARLIFTMNGTGSMVPPFISVTGLTD